MISDFFFNSEKVYNFYFMNFNIIFKNFNILKNFFKVVFNIMSFFLLLLSLTNKTVLIKKS